MSSDGWNLVEMISAFRSELASRDELALPLRRRLVSSLSESLEDDHKALVFHSLLGLACARKSWFVWESAFGDGSRPLELAEAVVSNAMRGNLTPSIGLKDLHDLQTDLDNRFLLGADYFPAVYAGFAAWAVLRDVLAGGSDEPGEEDSELDLSPDPLTERPGRESEIRLAYRCFVTPAGHTAAAAGVRL